MAVRVRVVPRLNSTTTGRYFGSMRMSSNERQRHLLQSLYLSESMCVRDTQLEFVFIQNSSTSEIIAGAEFLCRAGANDIFFDIGSFFANSFSITVANVFSMSVSVFPGHFKSFVLVNTGDNFVHRSFSLIQTLEIVFLDVGLNEVTGNATMSLTCINTSVFLYPAIPFTAISNITAKAIVPPFFLYVMNWAPSQTLLKIALTTANSTVYPHGTNVVTLQLNRSCHTGRYFAIHSYAHLYALLIANIDSAEFVSNCINCPNGTISDAFDTQTCR